MGSARAGSVRKARAADTTRAPPSRVTGTVLRRAASPGASTVDGSGCRPAFAAAEPAGATIAESHMDAVGAETRTVPSGALATRPCAVAVRLTSPLTRYATRATAGFAAARAVRTTSTWVKPAVVARSTRSTPGSTSA